MNWKNVQLKHLAQHAPGSFVDGPFGSSLKSDEYQDTGIPLIQLNNIRNGDHLLHNLKFISEVKANTLRRHTARPGDLVIAKMAEPVARGAIVNDHYDRYVVVADCVRVTLDTCVAFPPYIAWCMNSQLLKSRAEQVATGSTRLRINLGDAKNLKVPVPPVETQRRIAAFLDRKTAAIDDLIAKKQRLIELLEEKRAALINRVVTKGLNPDAPMKDSGVPWIGDIPAHWEIMQFRRVILDLCDGPFGSSLKSSDYVDSGIRLIRLQNIRNNYFDNSNQSFVSLEKAQTLRSHQASPGDLLIAGLGDTNNPVGRACVLPSSINTAIVKADCYRARLSERANHEFFAAYLGSKAGSAGFSFASRGATRTRINLSIVRDSIVALPSVQEQQQIVGTVHESNRHTNRLSQSINDTLHKLVEYRQALITAAVTGQIDVDDDLTSDDPEEMVRQQASLF